MRESGCRLRGRLGRRATPATLPPPVDALGRAPGPRLLCRRPTLPTLRESTQGPGLPHRPGRRRQDPQPCRAPHLSPSSISGTHERGPFRARRGAGLGGNDRGRGRLGRRDPLGTGSADTVTPASGVGSTDNRRDRTQGRRRVGAKLGSEGPSLPCKDERADVGDSKPADSAIL